MTNKPVRMPNKAVQRKLSGGMGGVGSFGILRLRRRMTLLKVVVVWGDAWWQEDNGLTKVSGECRDKDKYGDPSLNAQDDDG